MAINKPAEGANLGELLKDYLASPCASCAMLASFHYQTPEERDKNVFNCSGVRRAACAELHRMRLCGPPGTPGCNGDGTGAPSQETLDRAELEYKLHLERAQSLQRILATTPRE